MPGLLRTMTALLIPLFGAVLANAADENDNLVTRAIVTPYNPDNLGLWPSKIFHKLDIEHFWNIPSRVVCERQAPLPRLTFRREDIMKGLQGKHNRLSGKRLTNI